MKLSGEFFHAIEGLPDDFGMGYLRAIWYYRNHNHCKGLENESEFLRKICRIEKDRWELGFKTLFALEFFTLDENGLWQQKRAQQDYDEDRKKLIKHVERSQKMHAARWSRKKRK